MKNFFLDTNVLIDFFAGREPFALEAAHLFNSAYKKQIRVFISAVSFNNMYYILRQSVSHPAALKMLSELSEWTITLDVTNEIIKKSIKSDFRDFEDAIQYFCAKSHDKMDVIVTRNAKDFKPSALPVLHPREALALVRSSEK